MTATYFASGPMSGKPLRSTSFATWLHLSISRRQASEDKFQSRISAEGRTSYEFLSIFTFVKDSPDARQVLQVGPCLQKTLHPKA